MVHFDSRSKAFMRFTHTSMQVATDNESHWHNANAIHCQLRRHICVCLSTST